MQMAPSGVVQGTTVHYVWRVWMREEARYSHARFPIAPNVIPVKKKLCL